jgi:hypothetical protein
MTRKNQPDNEDAERDLQEGSLAFAVNKDLVIRAGSCIRVFSNADAGRDLG